MDWCDRAAKRFHYLLGCLIAVMVIQMESNHGAVNAGNRLEPHPAMRIEILVDSLSCTELLVVSPVGRMGG